jgi:AraC-like DNA-binding protein
MNQPHAITPHPHSYIAITVKGITQDVVFENIITPNNMELFYQLFHAIIEENSNSLSLYWDILYRYLCDYHVVSNAINPDEKFIIKALEFIKHNHHNQISVEDIAEHACLSTYHFCRLFKRLTGLSPHNCLKQYRLRQACKHLQNNTPVFDTAIETGFYDSSHFIKTFHSYMAVSPKEYQKSVLKNSKNLQSDRK